MLRLLLLLCLAAPVAAQTDAAPPEPTPEAPQTSGDGAREAAARRLLLAQRYCLVGVAGPLWELWVSDPALKAVHCGWEELLIEP